MEELKELLTLTEEKMEKTIQNLMEGLAKVRTGRASPTLVEDIQVDVYGQKLPLSQVGNISIPEARLIVINVWDKNNLLNVEKAILEANRNITPQNDGVVIRIPLPPMTEEVRKDMVKLLQQKEENIKVSIRNIRRDINEQIKKYKDSSGISEDEIYSYQDEVQKITDIFIQKITSICNQKKDELLTI